MKKKERVVSSLASFVVDGWRLFQIRSDLIMLVIFYMMS